MMQRRWMAAAMTFAALLCVTYSATAQQTAEETVRAEKLFTEASALVEQGKFDEACPKLEESQRLDPGLGTQFNLAVCYESIGKLATAWRNFKEVERLAHASGKKGREDAAHERVVAIRSRVGHFVFSVVAPDVTVSVDNAHVDRDALDFYAVDAGEHVISASAPTKRTWTTKASVAADPPGAEVRIEVPALTQTVVTVTKVKVTSNTQRTIGYAVGGVGIVGVVTAIVTGVMVLHNKSKADDNFCKEKCLDQSGIDAVSAGKTLIPINAVAWGVGVAGLGVGAALILTSKPKTTSEAAATPLQITRLRLGVTPSGATLLGTF